MCKLQIPRCRKCHNRRVCRRALPKIAQIGSECGSPPAWADRRERRPGAGRAAARTCTRELWRTKHSCNGPRKAASYQDGHAHVYGSNLPTLGGSAASTHPTPAGPNTSGRTGATYMSLNISSNDAANFMTGQFVTPRFVTDQAMAAQYSSYGCTQQSANMQSPGLTVA